MDIVNKMKQIILCIIMCDNNINSISTIIVHYNIIYHTEEVRKKGRIKMIITRKYHCESNSMANSTSTV